MSKININTASIDQLKSLPGIGAGLAKKVHDHIQEHGRFKKINELTKVKGISKDLLKKLSQYIRINTTSSKKKSTDSRKKRTAKIEFENFNGRNRGQIRMKATALKPFTVEFAKTDLLSRDNVPLSSVKLKRMPRMHSDNESILKFKIPLSRYTPAGTHSLDIVVDGQNHSLSIDIEEKTFVSISPKRFLTKVKPGTTISKEIFVKNQSNRPLLFGDPGPIILETDFIECRAIRHVVRNLDKETTSLDKILGLGVEKLTEIYDEGSTMKIRLKGGPKLITPGATVKFILLLSVPSTLKRPNRYTGVYKFFNASLTFTLIPSKEEG